ncbi:hypothetical protein V3481_012325 [Fusarium oxysporum f. sp. vasinfectum]
MTRTGCIPDLHCNGGRKRFNKVDTKQVRVRSLLLLSWLASKNYKNDLLSSLRLTTPQPCRAVLSATAGVNARTTFLITRSTARGVKAAVNKSSTPILHIYFLASVTATGKVAYLVVPSSISTTTYALT